MEYSVVLLLMTIVKVQGYYSAHNLNGTIFNSNNNHGYHNDVIDRGRHRAYFNEKQFENVLDHYRSDTRKREPRFISFQTKDDNIEVEIDFAIPFLSIPVKRSLSGAMGTFQNVIKGIPMANVNVGAVILTGIVIVGGAMIGGITRLLNGGNFIEVIGGLPWFRTNKKKQREDDSSDEGSSWWNILQEIDKALLKYDVDTTACTQRAICWYVKDSIANIEEHRATNFDHIVHGVTSSEFMQNYIQNTAWSSAISAGKKRMNCESTFPACKLSPDNLENFANNIKQFAKRRK